MSFLSLQTILWLGFQLTFMGLTLWISIIRLRQGATGSLLMITGSGINLIAGIALRVLPFIDLGFFKGGSSTGFGSDFWIINMVSAGASCGLILFLLGVLLHALRGSSESARIAELEAIINDRDQSGRPTGA